MRRSHRAPGGIASVVGLVLSLGTILAACAARQRPQAHAPRGPLLAFEAALGNRYVPAASASSVLAHVTVGVEAPDPRQRPPVNLALVVDTSGSMDGEAIESARAACLAVLQTLRTGDRVSLVVFHSRAEALVPSTVLDADNLATLRRRVMEMRAMGTTAMADGLAEGLRQLASYRTTGGIDRMVLLGDGVPNDARNIENLARSAASQGVVITSLGLGIEYDETLMGSIARLSGGRFRHIERSSDVAQIFREEVLRVRRVVARSAHVELTAGPGVAIESVVGRNIVRSGAGVRVSLGDITEGEPRELIVRLASPARRDGASVELLDAVLTYRDAMSGEDREQRLFLGARATNEDGTLTRGRNEAVFQAAARMQVAAGMIDAIRMVREGQLTQAEAMLDRAEQEVAQHAPGDRAHSLERERQAITRLRGVVSAMRRAPTRPTVTSGPAPAAAPSVDPTPEPAARELRQLHGDAMEAVY